MISNTRLRIFYTVAITLIVGCAVGIGVLTAGADPSPIGAPDCDVNQAMQVGHATVPSGGYLGGQRGTGATALEVAQQFGPRLDRNPGLERVEVPGQQPGTRQFQYRLNGKVTAVLDTSLVQGRWLLAQVTSCG